MKPKVTSKQRYIGLEIEGIVPQMTRQELAQGLRRLGLKNFDVVADGSIESDSGCNGCDCGSCGGETDFELRILTTKRGLEKKLRKVFQYLQRNGAYVNSTCGLHVHLDARYFDHRTMFKQLVDNLPRLKRLVDEERLYNNYCPLNTTNDFDAIPPMNHMGWRENWDREAINRHSYNEHKTIEVRLHEGTLDARKVTNWVNTLQTIAYNRAA